MIKILINAPKGGVGKTTLATNIALYLAKNNHRVWALDLAQGQQMTTALKVTEHFNEEQTANKIETRELESIPQRFNGVRNYDFLVADTDDYLEIIKDLADRGISRGWKVIVPIMDEYNGLQRIPQEIGALFVSSMFTGELDFNLKIVPNKIIDIDSIEKIRIQLENHGIEEFISESYITNCEAEAPYYINEENFNEGIRVLLEEIEVI
ncbi:nucleotide-binding protein [Bacillus cereus group sp. BfR-BA-01330]|uniref:nucleotide-binding protein n=1 Tax=Bacillus cereus group sp. BfR-BA-01330 TaxID=2920306 RepID=UPI001F5A5BA2